MTDDEAFEERRKNNRNVVAGLYRAKMVLERRFRTKTEWVAPDRHIPIFCPAPISEAYHAIQDEIDKLNKA